MMNAYNLLRPLFFLLPPEQAHALAMGSWQALLQVPGAGTLLEKQYRVADSWSHPSLPFSLPNRLGMAAGFDKNAVYTDALFTLGFGSVEIGTVTPRPQDGNPKPRLFRLPLDKALINRMGFNNAGADAVARNLEKRKLQGIVGGNIGKNKDTPNEQAHRDYVHCLKRLHGLVDYFTVNISSPNTPGLRALQDADSLRILLGEVQQANRAFARPAPLFLKIAPDLETEAAVEAAHLCVEFGFSGIIISNTSISRSGLRTPAPVVEAAGNGGLSGAPLMEPSTRLLREVRRQTGTSLIYIGSGGVMHGRDMQQKLEAGADLVQVYTGFVYRGPGLVKLFYREKSGL
jgi:dihydroorotate dehydrogenase